MLLENKENLFKLFADRFNCEWQNTDSIQVSI